MSERMPKLLLGLIGAGIQRSLTPALHEEEGRARGLRVHYQLIDLAAAHASVDVLPTLIAAARVMGFAGLNITFPCKQAVIPLLDELSPDAAAMGAVNTVVFRDGRAVGHNTDASGWRYGFERDLPGADLSRVVLLGAGGAGSAIAHALVQMQGGRGELLIVDADLVRAEALARDLGSRQPAGRVRPAAFASDAMRGASGLVHATPTGMDKMPGLPLDASALDASMWVSEIVYFPLETALVTTARARGCRVADGSGMAVGQAVGAFELFTGHAADRARVEAHFRSLIAPATRPGATASPMPAAA